MRTNIIFLILLGIAVWSAVQIFAMTLFRQNIRANFRPLIYSSISLSLVAGIIHYYQLSLLITTLQPIAIIIVFKLFYNFHWKHTVIIATTSYCISGFIEAGVHYIYSVISKNHIFGTFINDDFSLTIYIVLILIVLSQVIRQFRLGFTFIQNNNHVPKKNKKATNLLFGISLLCLLTFWVFAFAVFIHQSSPMFFFIVMVIFLLTLMLIRIIYHKEMAE